MISSGPRCGSTRFLRKTAFWATSPPLRGHERQPPLIAHDTHDTRDTCLRVRLEDEREVDVGDGDHEEVAIGPQHPLDLLEVRGDQPPPSSVHKAVQTALREGVTKERV